MEIESNIIGQLGKTAGRLAGLIDGQIRTTEIKVGDLDELFAAAGQRYVEPKLVAYRGGTPTA